MTPASPKTNAFIGDRKEFLRVLQRRVASVAIGPSTARRMGPKGTIKSAREFLSSISLGDFVAADEATFRQVLDEATVRLMKALPNGARHWGAARKFLNIFLRDATYTNFLRETYRLDKIEEYLEVPLDSQMAKWLHEHSADSLPPWKTVIGLKKTESNQFQIAASSLSQANKIARIHFDVWAWRAEKEEAVL